MAEVQFKNIPVHKWVRGPHGTGRNEMQIEKQKNYEKVMEKVGDLMADGHDVVLEHRIVCPKAVFGQAYDVIDIHVTKKGTK